ncbi:MAG TPA: hypothetical protein VJM46_00485 [Candidatus Saccharimonadales bacterium]|nr:hypothetical protein [Candidatus Saccharimonadales bacterium]
MSDPILLAEDSGVVVMYVVGHGKSAMTIFSSNARHNLGAAQGAIRQIAPHAEHVRYRPAQGRQAAHIIVNFAGELTEQVRRSYAGAFVEAVKLLS